MSQGIGQALLNFGGDAAGIFYNFEASGRHGSLRYFLRNEEELVARWSMAHSEEASIDALADNNKRKSRSVRS